MAVTDDEIIEGICGSLDDWALGDLYRALHLVPGTRIDPEKTTLDGAIVAVRGAFILGCSLLDAITCYWFNQESHRDRYQIVCSKLMPLDYNALGADNDLYFALRCGMLHNYQPANIKGNTETCYALTHNNYGEHLKRDKSGKTIVVNLQNFVLDVDIAFHRFQELLAKEGDVRSNSIKWATAKGWFDIGRVEVPLPDERAYEHGIEPALTTFSMPASGVVTTDGLRGLLRGE
jgi:hypothetical protein